ncbi:MAG: ABC transporter permease [Bacteroidales bacterium]|nr:ABC transporter permease [Bacteroidales bacterium]
MIWSIAWKNIWRSKVRSLVVIIAVTIGIFGAVMLIGIMQGWINQRVSDALNNEVSHIQIHHPEFLLNEEMKFTIPGYQTLIDSIENTTGIVAFSPRVKIFALAQTDWASSGLVLKGIDPESEKQVSKIHENLIEGGYFDDESVLPSMVIGSKAAENLKLLNYEVTTDKLQKPEISELGEETLKKLQSLEGTRYRSEKDFRIALISVLSPHNYKESGDMLVRYFSFYRLRAKVTVTAQKITGELVYLTFRVKGIYKTNNTAFDGLTAFVRSDVLKSETGLGADDYHEIAILTESKNLGVTLAKDLGEKFSQYEIMSWKELSPDLALYSDYMKVFDLMYVGIFLLALSFGIINTMLMAVLERVKELGMLMAIGMNKVKVFVMIMLESVFLTLTGAVVGMIVSGLVLSYFSRVGINLGMWAEGLEAIGYSAIIYPYISFDVYIGVILLVILTGILSSLWPARKALKLNPAEALRTE